MCMQVRKVALSHTGLAKQCTDARARVRVLVPVCASVSVRARACVRVCVRACVRVRVRAWGGGVGGGLAGWVGGWVGGWGVWACWCVGVLACGCVGVCLFSRVQCWLKEKPQLFEGIPYFDTCQLAYMCTRFMQSHKNGCPFT